MAAATVLDDLAELRCRITAARTVAGYTEYCIECIRSHGGISEETGSWQVWRRFSDFVTLHNGLQDVGINLQLPKKKMVGNLEKEFIAERQKGLQEWLGGLLGHIDLSASLLVRRFLDPANYTTSFQDISLQHVSMALRSQTRWEVLQALPNIGSRLRGAYFLVRDQTEPKVGKVLQWLDNGPFRTLGDRALASLARSLHHLVHPFLQKIEHMEVTESGALVISRFIKHGSLRDLLHGAKPKQPYLKKYSILGKAWHGLQLNDIRCLGWQILTAIQFLHDKGLPHGSLHSGNIFVLDGKAEVAGLANFGLGVSSRLRPLALENKAASSSCTSMDVYCFGHILYEMTFGEPLLTATTEDYPTPCPDIIKSVLVQLLSSEASRGSLPTIPILLTQPLFSLSLGLPVRPMLKISSATKEAVAAVVVSVGQRLAEDSRAVRQARRDEKSANENPPVSARRKASRQKSQRTEAAQLEVNAGNTPSAPAAPPPPPPVPSTPALPPPPPSAVPAPPAPPLAPPAPPPTAPAPPPAASAPPLPATSSGEGNRGALLSSITSFNKGGLRKATTMDKSQPKI